MFHNQGLEQKNLSEVRLIYHWSWFMLLFIFILYMQHLPNPNPIHGVGPNTYAQNMPLLYDKSGLKMVDYECHGRIRG